MYNLRTILNFIMTAIPVVLVLLILFRLLWKQNPVKFKDRLRRWVRVLPIILIVTIAGGAIAGVYQITGANLYGNFKIGYNYALASKGLTPNSTRLNADEILCDEVLENAISEGGLDGLEVYDLKQALNVRNALQRNSVSTENYYLSTEYVVDYNATNATKRFDNETILKAVYDAYYNYFVEKYGRKTYTISQDFSEVSELDYLDLYTYFSTRITNIINYMTMCRNENSSFVSDETQESFDSISEKAQDFRDVSLERFYAYILKYGLSKDKEGYISRLNYDNQMLNVRYMKNLAGYSVRLSAIEKYAGDITKAVLVPSRDEAGEFYQSRTKIGTDYFAADANDALESATDRQLEIEQNNYCIERLEAGTGGDSELAKAEEMVEELKDSIIEISSLAVQTVEDYDQQTLDDYMNVSYAVENGGAAGVIMAIVKYGFALFVLCSVAALVGDDIKVRRKRRRL